MASTGPKPFVFVLMPFKKEFDDVYDLGILPACKSAGAYCERVDKQIFTESILERTYNQIAKADIIVADMSEKNPNVFYEVGYAHALGKRTILITQNADDTPFDLKHTPHLIYGKSIKDLRPNLRKRVKYFLDHPESKRLITTDCLEYFVNARNIKSAPAIEKSAAAIEVDEPSDTRQPIPITLNLDIHNAGDQSLDTSQMRFGFVFPASLGKPVRTEHFVSLPGGNFMVNVTDVFVHLFPKFWLHKSIEIIGSDSGWFVTASYKCAIRTFTELSAEEIPFTLRIK